MMSIIALLVITLAMQCNPAHCFTQDNSILVPTTPLQVQQTSFKYSEQDQDYKQTQAIRFNQPLPSSWQQIRTSMVNMPMAAPPGSPAATQKRLCMNQVPLNDPCRPMFEPGYNFKLFMMTCYPYYRDGLYRVANEERMSGGGPSGGCDFDATSRTWSLTKVDSAKDMLNWTAVEDREVQRCHEPVVRHTRTETVMLKVVRGAVLHARAQGCTAGVATCKPCASHQVLTYQDSMPFCINKTSVCSLEVQNYFGCPWGFQVAANGLRPASQGLAKTVACEACAPNTYQPNSADDQGSGFRQACKPCAPYTEVKHWGSNSCSGCPAGHFPKNKMAPLECTKCPPGTFSPGSKKSCTKCTGGFYADVAGLASCKRCPTKWACLVPNKVLGRFATTPYRWDESGHPACPSLDGRTCWKADPESCADKLRKLNAGLAVKSVVCGQQHKKLWGYDGYSQPDHWCTLTKGLFVQPGPKGVGATGCSGNATFAAAASEMEPQQECSCCDQCKA